MSFISLFLFAAYFSFMQTDLVSINREVASLDLDNIKVESSSECSYVFDSLDKCLKIQGTIYVYGKTDGYSEFDFPIPNLVTPYFTDVPYEISISRSEEVECFSGQGVSKVGDSFRVEKISIGSFLKCRYTGEGKGYFEFEYEVPIFQTFAVKEAEWMKGFFPDIVSNAELTLSNIYQKWVEANKKLTNPSTNDVITYRGRELLLKYEGDSEHKIFDPRKNEFQFELKLSPGDLVEVSNINGKINHSKFGQSDYLGFATDDFLKLSNAGKKYLVPKGVKPYGFFCTHNNKVFNFEYSYSHVFDTAGLLKCSINTRSHNLFWLQRPKGQVEVTLKVMDLNKIMNRIPLRLANPKTRISNKINSMNAENSRDFTKWISRSLKAHDNSIKALNEVDKVFSFQKLVNAKVESSILTQKPQIRIDEKLNQSFLNLSLFQRKSYKGEEGLSFIVSDLALGSVITSTRVYNKSIKKYEKQFVFKEYSKSLSHLKDLKNKSYSAYLNEINKVKSLKSDEQQDSDYASVLLNRYMTQVCGKIEFYINSYNAKKQKITLSSIKAVYDTPQGGIVGDLRETSAHLFYSESVSLEKDLVIYSHVDYERDQDQCYYLSAPNFVSKNYRDAIFSQSF